VTRHANRPVRRRPVRAYVFNGAMLHDTYLMPRPRSASDPRPALRWTLIVASAVAMFPVSVLALLALWCVVFPWGPA
jgi:hypothetical protein